MHDSCLYKKPTPVEVIMLDRWVTNQDEEIDTFLASCDDSSERSQCSITHSLCKVTNYPVLYWTAPYFQRSLEAETTNFNYT